MQWGTARMLGTFLTENPTAAPASTAAFVTGQLDVAPGLFGEYVARPNTAYEHTREVRDAYGYRDFTAGEGELRKFLAARMWPSREGPRARPGAGVAGGQPGAAAGDFPAVELLDLGGVEGIAQRPTATCLPLRQRSLANQSRSRSIRCR
ncbi:DUF4158 domain-containing protein [Streptomyces sp. NPDC090442]|uniref:DUF4158 domain-containing protein n=1 Tax=Streptomyces sp. NPDC090442 TaxID=3365962 RepID=UPI00380C3FB5